MDLKAKTARRRERTRLQPGDDVAVARELGIDRAADERLERAQAGRERAGIFTRDRRRAHVAPLGLARRARFDANIGLPAASLEPICTAGSR